MQNKNVADEPPAAIDCSGVGPDARVGTSIEPPAQRLGLRGTGQLGPRDAPGVRHARVRVQERTLPGKRDGEQRRHGGSLSQSPCPPPGP